MKKYFFVLLLLFVSTTGWAANAEKEWTMLVFLNGHNNLDSFGQVNVDQMASASNPNVNIIVEWASLQYGKTRRVEVSRGKEKVVQELDAKLDMGDYKNLIEFIQWGVKNYPAKHYFIDIWNHGDGWKFREMDAFRGGQVLPRNISYDDLSGHSIDTPQMGLAMQAAAKAMGHPVDIYGSDACLMQMIEVDYQMKGYVNYVVGSEETIPGEGWRYDALLNKWGSTPVEVATSAVSTYFSSGYQDATMSAVDMSQIDGVVLSLKDLQSQLLTAKGVQGAVNASLGYTLTDYIDLGDFLINMKKADPTVNVAGVQDAMSKFIFANQASGIKAASQGLSIWLPTSDSGDMPRYNVLNFDQLTHWGQMLQKMWSSR